MEKATSFVKRLMDRYEWIDDLAMMASDEPVLTVFFLLLISIASFMGLGILVLMFKEIPLVATGLVLLGALIFGTVWVLRKAYNK